MQHLNSVKLEDFHVKLIRPFYHDANYINPYEVATADTQSFIVEECLKYRFKGKQHNKTNMEILIKWKGHTETTWEPYANVASVAVFHQYLRDNGLSRLLRDNFKQKV